MSVLTLPEAEDLAARTLTGIDERHAWASRETDEGFYLLVISVVADRERVASDLAGLRECWAISYSDRLDLRDLMASHARRYSDNLRRTAALYGVQP